MMMDDAYIEERLGESVRLDSFIAIGWGELFKRSRVEISQLEVSLEVVYRLVIADLGVPCDNQRENESLSTDN